MTETEIERQRRSVSLDLLYVALENLLLALSETDEPSGLTLLVALARDLEASITEYWQSLDVGVVLDDLDV